MCGIVGTIGGAEALPVLLEGLRRESYRGYDSSGVVVFGRHPRMVRAVGHLESLEAKLRGVDVAGQVGLGHNRWATHGAVTEANAHPHADCRGRIFVVHNGIIENHGELKERLTASGHRFSSETDTEVVAHLIEHFFRGTLEDAVRQALRLVRGAYGLAVLAWDDPGKIVAARLSSPLAIAVNGDSGHVASDPAALVAHATNVVYLDDDDIAVLEPGRYAVTDLQNTIRVKAAEELDWDVAEAQKGGYAHFTLKEIHEQPESLSNTLRGRLIDAEGSVRLGGLRDVADRLAASERLHIIACGTASYAGMIGAYMLEEYARIPTVADIASEFRYRSPIVDGKTAYLFISQSGETADTLWSLREVKQKHGLALGIVNVVGSSVARESHAGVYTHAGPEISVMSTKAFTSQLAVLAMLTVLLGRQRAMAFTHLRPDAPGVSPGRKDEGGAPRDPRLEPTLPSWLRGPGRGEVGQAPDGFRPSPAGEAPAGATGMSPWGSTTAQEIVRALARLPEQIRETLRVADQVANVAEKYRAAAQMLLIGRKYSYPVALEGAMKLKEAAYVHGQGFGAGELKHGSLALVDEKVPTVAICPSDSVYEKTLSNIQEVRARRGPVIAIATEGNTDIANVADDVVYVPKTLEMLTPLLTVIPLQLFAYSSGVLRGVDVDKPRNLAKSVTVE